MTMLLNAIIHGHISWLQSISTALVCVHTSGSLCTPAIMLTTIIYEQEHKIGLATTMLRQCQQMVGIGGGSIMSC
jgi:hypothetical protein